METSKWVFAFSAFCAITTACEAPPRAVVVDDEPIGSECGRLFVLKATLWDTPSAIPVCWESAGFDTEKAWVANALAVSWETAAPRIHFTGFARCAAADNGIRIVIDSFDQEGPHVVDFGKNLAGIKNGMVLDFAFSGPDFPKCTTTEAMRERCIRAIATHEFGHALGFRHEQARADTPASCTLGREPAGDDGTTVGAWDLMSIMNYCYPDRENVFPTLLSPTDVQGAREMYPSLATPDAGASDDAASATTTTPTTADAGGAAPSDGTGATSTGAPPSTTAHSPSSSANAAAASSAAPSRRISYMAPANSGGCSLGTPAASSSAFAMRAWALALVGLVAFRRRRAARPYRASCPASA